MATITGGYDFDLAEDNGIKEFECPICLYLVRDAHELPCSHLLCKICLHKWSEECVRRRISPHCPLCQSAYDIANVNPVKIVNRVVLTSVKVKCKQSKDGCRWIGVISDYDVHAAGCAFILVTCCHDGCNEYWKRNEIKEHEKSCPFRITSCQHCGEEMPGVALERHIDVTCQQVVISCPKCKEDVKRGKIESHLKATCAYEGVQCPYIDIGCKVQVLRKDQLSHHADCMPDHNILLLNLAEDLKSKLQVKSNEIESMKNELSTTTKELASTRAKMLLVEKDLRIVREKAEETANQHSQFVAYTEKRFAELTKANQARANKEQPVQDKAESSKGGVVKFDGIVTPSTGSYTKKVKSIMRGMEENKYYNHTENMLFFKLKVVDYKGQVMYLAVVDEENSDIFINDTGRLLFECGLYRVVEIDKGESFCVYIYNPKPSSSYEILYAYHPANSEKVKIAPHSSRVPVNDFSFNDCILLRLDIH